MKPERLGPEISIKTRELPMGLPSVNRRAVSGFVLATGFVLLDSERDPQAAGAILRRRGHGRHVSENTAHLYAGARRIRRDPRVPGSACRTH